MKLILKWKKNHLLLFFHQFAFTCLVSKRSFLKELQVFFHTCEPYVSPWAVVVAQQVECTPHKQEVVDLNPAGGWTFFFFYLFLLSFSSGVSLFKFLKEVHLKLFVVKAIQNRCLAVLRYKLRLGKK